MKMSKVIAFLPCRKGSQRVQNKNTRPFSGITGGLTHIKISQLLKVNAIEQIIVSTNDEDVKKIAHSFDDPKIIIDERPEILARASTSTDDLISYLPGIITSGVVLWTHVTSPFVDETVYQEAIEHYYKNLKSYDSLMSVTKIQKFLWDEHGAVNYDRDREKWPRTQTIKPLYEINSGIFLADRSIYETYQDRIGERPCLYALNDRTAFDIDWEVDFEMAEVLWSRDAKI